MKNRARVTFYRDLRETRDLCYWTVARMGRIGGGFYGTNQGNRVRHGHKARVGGAQSDSTTGSGCQCQRQVGRLTSKSARRSTRTNNTDLYVVRINGATGKPATARPCWRCVAWCEWAGVKRIFYWDENKNGFEVMRIGGGQCIKEMVYRTRSDWKMSCAKEQRQSQ